MALPYSALLLLYDGFNTLDVNAPLEVFRKSGYSKYFNVKIAAEKEITESTEGALMKRHIALDNEDAISAQSLSKYDLLIVPGGAPEKTAAQNAKIDSFFMRCIGNYAKLKPAAGKQRILLSICVGAIFCGTMGVYNGGRYCTTHWLAYDTLRSAVAAGAKAADGDTKPGRVIPARFVDSGLNASGVRIISSGGISCGLDGSLYTVKTVIATDHPDNPGLGEQEAKDTAALLDYAYRQTDGVVLSQQ